MNKLIIIVAILFIITSPAHANYVYNAASMAGAQSASYNMYSSGNQKSGGGCHDFSEELYNLEAGEILNGYTFIKDMYVLKETKITFARKDSLGGFKMIGHRSQFTHNNKTVVCDIHPYVSHYDYGIKVCEFPTLEYVCSDESTFTTILSQSDLYCSKNMFCEWGITGCYNKTPAQGGVRK